MRLRLSQGFKLQNKWNIFQSLKNSLCVYSPSPWQSVPLPCALISKHVLIAKNKRSKENYLFKSFAGLLAIHETIIEIYVQMKHSTFKWSKFYGAAVHLVGGQEPPQSNSCVRLLQRSSTGGYENKRLVKTCTS